MNRTTHTLAWLGVALTVSLGAAHAQLRPKSPPPALPGPWANKLFIPNVERDRSLPAPRVLVYDFGTVPYGTICTQKFTLTNPYEVPLQVLDVRVECGCLKANPPTKVLQPNESAEFVVTMDAGKFRGPNAKKMFVTFGPDNISAAELEFRATSREDVSITPGQVDFGFVAQGRSPKAQSVTIKYEGRLKDWRITDVVRPSDALDVECKELARSGLFAVSYQVTVTLKNSAAPGLLAEPLVLKTNDPASPFLKLNVTATVQPTVAVIPEKVTFRDSTVGVERQYKVLVRGGGGVPFTLKPTDPDEPGPRVEGILPASNTLHHVLVKYQPTAPGPFRHEVKLNTSLGGPPLVLIVEGEAK